MSLDKSEIISAEVIPALDVFGLAMKSFISLGFQVGPEGPSSFSIVGPVQKFEDVFQSRLRRSAKGGVECVDKRGSVSLEFPLEALPQDVINLVQAVTFTEIDFGPIDF